MDPEVRRLQIEVDVGLQADGSFFSALLVLSIELAILRIRKPATYEKQNNGSSAFPSVSYGR